MDPVERVIGMLQSQKTHLRAERDAQILRFEAYLDPGGKVAIQKVKMRYIDQAQVIDYVINFLENEKEE